MTRLEKLHRMTADEIAAAILKNGMDGRMDFCQCNEECYGLLDAGGPLLESMCRKCLTEYLNSEDDLNGGKNGTDRSE